MDEDVVGGDVGSDKEIQYAFLLSLLQLQNEPLFCTAYTKTAYVKPVS